MRRHAAVSAWRAHLSTPRCCMLWLARNCVCTRVQRLITVTQCRPHSSTTPDEQAMQPHLLHKHGHRRLQPRTKCATQTVKPVASATNYFNNHNRSRCSKDAAKVVMLRVVPAPQRLYAHDSSASLLTSLSPGAAAQAQPRCCGWLIARRTWCMHSQPACNRAARRDQHIAVPEHDRAQCSQESAAAHDTRVKPSTRGRRTALLQPCAVPHAHRLACPSAANTHTHRLVHRHALSDAPPQPAVLPAPAQAWPRIDRYATGATHVAATYMQGPAAAHSILRPFW